jgi:hypothetical protein
MALTYALTGIDDWQTRCYVQQEDESSRMNPVTEALILATMAIGLRTITKSNVDEFAHRIEQYQRVSGALLNRWDAETAKFEPLRITYGDVRDHIGLTTNASTFTKATFKANLFRILDESVARQLRNDKESIDG